MSSAERNKLKQDAKAYVQALYTQHRTEDVEAWERLIDLLFLYIDSLFTNHEDVFHEAPKE